MKVFIYRNLTRKGNIFSLKALEGPVKGRVIGYAHGICVSDCKLVVSQAGRERVLKQKRRNVHAGIVGDVYALCGYEPRIHLSDMIMDPTHYNDESFIKMFRGGSPITYNPFYHSSFILKGSNTPIHKASQIMFFHDRVEILKI